MSQQAHIVDRTDIVKEGVGNADLREPLYDFLTDNGVNIVKSVNTESSECEYCGWEIDKAELKEFVEDLDATIVEYPDYMKDKDTCGAFADKSVLVGWLKELLESSATRSCVFVEWF